MKKLNLLHCMHEHFPIFQAHNATARGSGDTFIKSDLIIYKGSIKLWIFKCIIFRQINKLQQRTNRNTLHSAEHSLCYALRQLCDSRAVATFGVLGLSKHKITCWGGNRPWHDKWGGAKAVYSPMSVQSAKHSAESGVRGCLLIWAELKAPAPPQTKEPKRAG